MARLFGKQQDVKEYDKLAEKVKEAFNRTFFNKDTKQYANGSETAAAISVYMELVEPQYKDRVIDNIIKDIRNSNNSLTAGDIVYRYLQRVLDDNGRSDVIFDTNSRADVPGYGHQLAYGATALTESWQVCRFVSNNHFMPGHLMKWFYNRLKGIRIAIRPEPAVDAITAKANYLSPCGTISSDWKKGEEAFELSTEIPANTTAIIYLPARGSSEITESGKLLSNRNDVKFLRYVKGKALIAVSADHYEFKVK